ALTDAGKVIGIHSETGKVIWDKYYNSVQEFKKIFLVKKGSTLSPELIVISRNTNGKFNLTIINPLDGAELSNTQLDYSVVQAFLLPFKDENHRQVLAIIDTDHIVHIVPNSKSAIKLVS